MRFAGCCLLVLTGVSVCLCKPFFNSGDSGGQAGSDSIESEVPRSSTKNLHRGDVLLVSVSPVSDEFQLLGPNGEKNRGISMEHVRGTKKHAFVVNVSGEHTLVVESRDREKSKKHSHTVDVVDAAISPDEKLDRLVQHLDSDVDPGAAVTVTINGNKSLVQVFGCADVEHRVRVNPTTVFDTASMAKHVAGLVIVMLDREGKLSLDDDVRKHISEVPDFGATITLRHLVHHTSGLRDFPGLMVLGQWHDYDVITLDQVIELVRRQEDLNFAPGSEFTYSNTGYSLLAETVQRVTGDSLAEWSHQHLFVPLGMKNTTLLSDIRTLVSNRARGYSLAGPGELMYEPNNLAAMGSSSFLTTGSDMALWMNNFDLRRVSGDALTDLMKVEGKLSSGKSTGYGFGLGHGTYRGLRRLQHGGSSGGYRSHLLRFPEQRTSISVLCNHANMDPEALAYFAADLFLGPLFEASDVKPGAPSRDNSTRKGKQDVVVDTATLDTYVGSYQLNPNEVIAITREGKSLMIRPQGHPEVSPIVAKSLTMTRFTGPPGGTMEFVADQNGTITKALMRQGEQIVMQAKKLSDFDVAKVDLTQYAGVYFSRELDVHYELTMVNDGLVARQAKRTRKLNLITRDRFRTDDGIVIEMTRDGGQVKGFKASTGSRVRDVRFAKK